MTAQATVSVDSSRSALHEVECMHCSRNVSEMRFDMAILTVRNLKPEVHQLLRERAARHGRSMEAETRAIIEDAVCAPDTDLVTLVRRFATEAQITDAESSTIFPGRSKEFQRQVDLDGPK